MQGVVVVVVVVGGGTLWDLSGKYPACIGLPGRWQDKMQGVVVVVVVVGGGHTVGPLW